MLTRSVSSPIGSPRGRLVLPLALQALIERLEQLETGPILMPAEGPGE